MEKLKVMISQPMRGLTEEEIRTNRKNVVEKLEELGFEVVDTVLPDYPTHLAEKEKAIPIWYLSKSIEFMSGVDVVCMINDWQSARGCRIEHQIAHAYELDIIYEECFDMLED